MSAFSKIAVALILTIGVVNTYAADEHAGQEGLTLQRVVLFMRHGVRPPTKSAEAMAPLSDAPWPNEQGWGAAPGELTPHGGMAIRKLGHDLRDYYVGAGLLPTSGSIASQTLIWADGADQRTRETAKMLSRGLTENGFQTGSVHWSNDLPDPLFDALSTHICKMDPEAAQSAVLAEGSLENREISVALGKMQSVVAPLACYTGGGICLASPSKLTATEQDVKISGPLSTAATISEVFLLEYENGFPMEQVAFNRASASEIAQLLLIHEHTSNLTRRTPYIATRRAFALVQFILNALSSDSVNTNVPAINAQQNFIVLIGHDTNLSNLAGVFGLNWHLDGQPDVTAPGTTIAFEHWRDNKTGQAILQMRLFYQGMEQVRHLSETPVRSLAIRPAACADSSACEMNKLVNEIKSILPKDCHH